MLLLEQSDHTVEIFYFFDPFSDDCITMEPIINKLLIEYRGHITIKKILAPSLSVLTKCQAQSTSSDDNVALAYKAAEIQGQSKARAFIRYIFNRINPSNTICTKEMIDECKTGRHRFKIFPRRSAFSFTRCHAEIWLVRFQRDGYRQPSCNGFLFRWC